MKQFRKWADFQLRLHFYEMSSNKFVFKLL